MESQYNNVDTTLDIAGTWNGEAELCNGYVIILVYIKSSKRCTLKVRQSDNKSNYNFIETVEYLPITGEARYQIYRSSLYCYVEVINDSGEVIPDLIVRTHFLNIGRDSSIYYPTVVAGAVDVVNFPAVQPVSGSVSIANIQTTSTGDLIVNGSSSSAKRDVYLMIVNTWYRVASVGNTPGHVWNSIGAIVGGENIPTVGRLFKCLYVPSNIQGQGQVFDVEYNDVVTATPVGTQDVNIVNTVTVPVSGSVALLPAVDPTLTLGTVRLNDAYGSPLVTTAGNLMVGINNIYTTNPLHTILDSGTVTLTELSTSVVSLSTITNTHQDIKNAPGTLKSILITYNNAIVNVIAYVKIYDDLTPTGSSSPKIVLPVVSGTTIQFDCHNLAFNTGITICNVDSFGNGSTPPSGTLYATVLYN